jgi:hypothetical protein
MYFLLIVIEIVKENQTCKPFPAPREGAWTGMLERSIDYVLADIVS